MVFSLIIVGVLYRQDRPPRADQPADSICRANIIARVQPFTGGNVRSPPIFPTIVLRQPSKLPLTQRPNLN
jgi:hypothetical protein